MKKTLVSFLATVAVISSAWAAEIMNMYDQVNNTQTPAHQIQSSASRSAVQGEGMKMMSASDHEQAAISHDMMQNGTPAAHQGMADMHRKMMNTKTETTGESTKSLSKMNEHEKAAVIHEKANNGQFSVIHQQQADKHHSQSVQNQLVSTRNSTRQTLL